MPTPPARETPTQSRTASSAVHGDADPTPSGAGFDTQRSGDPTVRSAEHPEPTPPRRPPTRRSVVTTWRRLAVWMHILTSVGWMTCAIVLFALLVPALSGDAAWAITAAHHIDTQLLAALANASAATGIVLALATPWGLTLHRWVLVKLVITVVQLVAGIVLLSAALNTAAETLEVSFPLVAGTALMAAAIAFQAWLSVAKPGRRRGTRKPPTAPAWVFATAVLAPLLDATLGLVLGFPSPLFAILAIALAATARIQARP